MDTLVPKLILALQEKSGMFLPTAVSVPMQLSGMVRNAKMSLNAEEAKSWVQITNVRVHKVMFGARIFAFTLLVLVDRYGQGLSVHAQQGSTTTAKCAWNV